MNNGWIKIHRSILDSEIWVDKPATWFIIWIYILLKVSHKKHGRCKRGEGYFNFSQERLKIGKDITKDIIKKAVKWFKQEGMIGTSKSTRGMYIKVLNYAQYQDYTKDEAPQEAPQRHHRGTTIDKNVRIKEYNIPLTERQKKYKAKYGCLPVD